MFDIISTREVAVGAWLVIFILFLLFYKPTRKCIADLLKTACSIQLSLPFLLMIVYATGVTYLFFKTPLWKAIYIKDIALWVVFVGTPMFFGSLNKKAEEHYFKTTIKNSFKLTVLVEFFVSTFTLPLVWEILLVPVMTFLLMLGAAAATDSQYRPAKKLIHFIIVILNVMFIIETISIATKLFSILDKTSVVISLFIPIVFSFLYIPISYLFAAFGKYQTIFIRMNFKEPKGHFKIKLVHRFKVIWSCGLSLTLLEQFEKNYIQHMFSSMNDVDFENLMRGFRVKHSPQNSSKQSQAANKKIIDEIKEANFQETIKYINAHIGIFTLFATFCIGLLSVIIKGFLYVFMCGKFDYWGIDHSYINISNENLLYEIVLYAALTVIFITLNLIPFSVMISKSAWYIKLFKSVLLTIVTSFIISCIFLVSTFITKEISFVEVINVPAAALLDLMMALIVQLIPVTLVIYLMGWCMSIPFLKQRNKINSHILIHKLFSTATIFPLVLGLSLYIIMAYSFGKNSASEQKTFNIINNYSVVIYEDAEHYVISDCTIAGEHIIIDSSRQKLTDKESIETVKITFKVAEQKT